MVYREEDAAMQDQTAPQTVTWPTGRNAEPLMELRDVDMWYGSAQALFGVSFELYPNEVLAFIGPSGCGKSSALKLLNRMHDSTRDARIEGAVEMNGHDIYARDIDPPVHRRRFGWVAQKPNPFPRSIWENVAYPARIQGLARTKSDMEAHVERCLRRAHLWDEVKEDLHTAKGTDLSGGQQQRLCIARALAQDPQVLLMDEPTGSIDPIATQIVENLIVELKADASIVLVTHSMNQARRIADRVLS
jgi:ABC-type phosphate transport system, ATPase component